MSKVTHISRPNTADRLTALESRADAHDVVAKQVGEMYEVFDKGKTILGAMNWFWVKIVGGAFAALGALAVILTIIEKAGQLLGHHGT